MILEQVNDKLIEQSDGESSHKSWFIQGLIDYKFRFPQKSKLIIPRIFRKDYQAVSEIAHRPGSVPMLGIMMDDIFEECMTSLLHDNLEFLQEVLDFRAIVLADIANKRK